MGEVSPGYQQQLHYEKQVMKFTFVSFSPILSSGSHNVLQILEKSTLNNEIGAAIHLAPNGTRVLLSWGFSPVRAQLVTARRSLYADGKSLEVTHVEIWDDDKVEREFGAKFYLAHRVDLHAELKFLATREDGGGIPVIIETGCEVLEYVCF